MDKAGSESCSVAGFGMNAVEISGSSYYKWGPPSLLSNGDRGFFPRG
jgi:hypothetical protein